MSMVAAIFDGSTCHSPALGFLNKIAPVFTGTSTGNKLSILVTSDVDLPNVVLFSSFGHNGKHAFTIY